MGFFSNLFGGGAAKKAAGKSTGGAEGKRATKKIANVTKRFDLRGRTGQGSMSKVFQAYDRDLGRTVALKLLDKEKTKKFEERFKGLKKPSEGDICSGLDHPNLVKTYEYGVTTAGEPYIVMEWVEGLGLNFLVETQSPHMNGHRVDYMVQLCEAVEYLHGKKFIHRDLCPRNVMVSTDGVVKLIDFGLTIPYTPDFTKPGNRTGTSEYLAPEIIKRLSTDHRVDVYALGITAYEVFTGQMPWERTTSSEETYRRRLNTPPKTAGELRPDLDDDVSRVLMKAIEKERGARYASVAQFRDGLARLKRQNY